MRKKYILIIIIGGLFFVGWQGSRSLWKITNNNTITPVKSYWNIDVGNILVDTLSATNLQVHGNATLGDSADTVFLPKGTRLTMTSADLTDTANIYANLGKFVIKSPIIAFSSLTQELFQARYSYLLIEAPIYFNTDDYWDIGQVSTRPKNIYSYYTDTQDSLKLNTTAPADSSATNSGDIILTSSADTATGTAVVGVNKQIRIRNRAEFAGDGVEPNYFLDFINDAGDTVMSVDGANKSVGIGLQSPDYGFGVKNLIQFDKTYFSMKIGPNALGNMQQYYNIAIGDHALASLTNGNQNTVVGLNALNSINNSGANTALGYMAGTLISDGSSNTNAQSSVFIGSSGKALAVSDTNEIVIGNSVVGNGSNTATLGNDDIKTTFLKGDIYTHSTDASDSSSTNSPFVKLTGEADTATGTAVVSVPRSWYLLNDVKFGGDGAVPDYYLKILNDSGDTIVSIDGVNKKLTMNGNIEADTFTGTATNSDSLNNQASSYYVIDSLQWLTGDTVAVWEGGATRGKVNIPRTAFADSSDKSAYSWDSDKWDGYQFADYLDQGVRTIDAPTFAGGTINGDVKITGSIIDTSGLISGKGTFTATATTDTIVLTGVSATDVIQASWWGSTIPTAPLSVSATAGTIFVYCSASDTVKASTEGFSYVRFEHR